MSAFAIDHDAALAPMQQTFVRMRAAFRREMMPSHATRIDRLARLARMTKRHAQDIIDAISADFGNRSPHETLIADLLSVDEAIKHATRHLRHWMRPRRMPTGLKYRPGHNRLIPQPLGVVGVVAPWNYPYQLSMLPAVAALAAGNRVMIKPSEITPGTALLMERIVRQTFDEDEVAVFPGDAEAGKAFVELPFDHLFFTGSTAVGRLVAQGAAKNLTPVTLELGGKSPVIVDADADFAAIMPMVAIGKLFNAGQTCIAPDYALVPRRRIDEFCAAMTRTVASLYPTLAANRDYASHRQRTPLRPPHWAYRRCTSAGGARRRDQSLRREAGSVDAEDGADPRLRRRRRCGDHARRDLRPAAAGGRVRHARRRAALCEPSDPGRSRSTGSAATLAAGIRCCTARSRGASPSTDA